MHNFYAKFQRRRIANAKYCTHSLAVWHNLPKFCHCSEIYKSLCNFLMVYSVYLSWKFWIDFAYFYVVRKIFIIANSQLLKNNLAIWSHCIVCFTVGPLSSSFCHHICAIQIQSAANLSLSDVENSWKFIIRGPFKKTFNSLNLAQGGRCRLPENVIHNTIDRLKL